MSIDDITPINTTASSGERELAKREPREPAYRNGAYSTVDLSSVYAASIESSTSDSPACEAGFKIETAAAIPFKPQQCANESGPMPAPASGELPTELNRQLALEQKLAYVTAALEQAKLREQQLLHHAFHDNLTGLPNVELFQDRLVNAMVQAERHQCRIAVMFIDLDGFKNINDTHGHDIGDCLLKIVAQRLQKLVRRGDTVCRRSGDEFLFLMPEAKNKETVVSLAEKIAGKIADPCRIGELEVATSASVGVAVYPEDGRFPNELLKNADAAMYAAKKRRISFALYREWANL